MVLTNAMQYAVEVNPLAANPLKAVKWTRPRTLKTVDQRAVTNADQARRFLAAVAGTGPRGERIIAFLGCLYYATLRPEEAVDLSRGNLLNLPDQGWGEMLLTHSEPRSGTSWTDNGLARQRRELKHRAPGETRTAPVHPELVALFRDHLQRFGTGPGGRIFIGPRGGILTDRAYLAVFHQAGAAAFTGQEAASLLGRRPYELRHAAVSTWLNAGVAPPRSPSGPGTAWMCSSGSTPDAFPGSRTRRSSESSTRQAATLPPGRFVKPASSVAEQLGASIQCRCVRMTREWRTGS